MQSALLIKLPDVCFQQHLLLKHLKPTCSGSPLWFEEARLMVSLFIYIQTSVCMAVKKNNLSHCVQIQVVHTCTYLCLCMKKNISESHNIAFFVIALLQHTDTQRATKRTQAVTLIHKRRRDNRI